MKILVQVIGLLEMPNAAKNIWTFWEERELATIVSDKLSKESVPTRMLSKTMIISTSSAFFAKSLCRIHIQSETVCASVKWKEFFVTY